MQRVVVAGDGHLGAITALALKKALPSAEVMVVGTPPDPAAWADRANSALPFSNRLHDRLGITEESLLTQAGASHRLVTRMIGWGGTSSDSSPQHGAVPYGMSTDASLKTRFAQEWGGGSRSGTEAGGSAHFAGSVAEVLAAQGRFGVLPAAGNHPLGDVDYALRWNPGAYRHVIIQAAAAAGVRHVDGAITDIVPDGMGGIAALTITGEGRVTGDLFVDCTGPSAQLLSAITELKPSDWSDYLPVRRLAVAAARQPVLSLEDRFSLPQQGWLSEVAGRDGVHMVLGLPDGVSDETVTAMFGQAAAEIVPLSPGAAPAPWSGNVVALGDAAAQFEPLAFLNLDLAHRQLDLLLEMLPGQTIDPRERAEYNRRANLMADGVRDVLGVHYAAPAAQARFGLQKRSPVLARMLDQFTRRGRMPFSEEGPFLSQELSGLLAALGIESGLTPLACADGNRLAQQSRDAFQAKAQAALQAAPAYGEWLGQIMQGNNRVTG